MPINDNPPTGHTCPNCGHQWGYYAPMPDWDNPPPIPPTPPLSRNHHHKRPYTPA